MSGQREDDALPDDGLTDYWPSEDELNETVELDTTMVDALLKFCEQDLNAANQRRYKRLLG